jgi:hypothetical protein
MTGVRGRRYQVSDNHLAGMWMVLDVNQRGEDGKHPIVASESSRKQAREKARELNEQEHANRSDKVW